MQTDDLIVVAEYTTSMEAELAKSLLMSAGIYAEIHNPYMTDIYPGVVAAQLLVTAERADEARQLLDARQD